MENNEELYSLPAAAGQTVSWKRYEWQLFVGHQWLTIDNNHVIETHYCQPGAKGITLNTSQGKVFIDFDNLQTTDPALKVQRVSFLPQGQTEEVGWYFRDNHLWREYGSQGPSMSASSISSKDVEHQFALNPQGNFIFTVGSASYRLDFTTMTQTNCATGFSRNLRRRPKFPSIPGRLHTTSVPSKWEFMGNEGEWTEYQTYLCSFGSTDIERQYQLNPQGQIHFTINSFSYTLDFSSMCQVNNNIGTRRMVRRTVDDRGQQRTRLVTQPHWQFEDVGRQWKDYSNKCHQCSISSQDIELQYQQNPSGIMTFTTECFSYELNFSTMTQRNLSTNTKRSVRRLNQ
ncbi:hypothetical protein Q5P01_003654 [Channa striata]|uniref:WWE domain-containing protein n=1 Tax=Channa striata TaxID=64152 RepID=A0AA88T1J1_CHASR|nr:hypothetical protein Q5P01_003654 [Channa striata]